MSWPETVAGDLLLDSSATVGSTSGAVNAVNGSFGTALALPSYSPNIPGLVLAYNSQSANPQPLIIERHTLSDTLAAPTYTSVQLTLNGTAGTTYYYDTSKLSPGSIQEVPQAAAAASLSTGRYAYSFTVADVRTTTTTSTVSGVLSLDNESGSAFGAGWTLAGLGRVYPLSGGVLLTPGWVVKRCGTPVAAVAAVTPVRPANSRR